MSKSLVTIDEAVARMINFGYIHPECTLLEMTQSLKQTAGVCFQVFLPLVSLHLR